MTKSVVIALGGNALLDPSGRQSFLKQNRNMERVAESITALYRSKHCRILITHGNGSQVGDEIMRNEHAKGFVPKLPIYAINAETQALIGTAIATTLRNSFESENEKQNVGVVLAHILVDKKDPAFKHPTKQVGPFYTREELGRELALDPFTYIKSGSKYRRVIASPDPKRILELSTIKEGTKNGIIVTCGGGGVPMIKTKGRLVGVDAVIDKDLTGELLASSVKADMLVILTNADFVYRDYAHKKGPIKEIRVSELKRMLGTFEEGTIRPKIEACIRFIKHGGKEAYIGNVFELERILSRKSGTRIS